MLPAPRPNLVFYIDQTALENRARQATIQQLRDFLLSRPAGTDRVMVAAFEQNLNVLQLPTTDRASLEQAFDKLKERPSRAGLGSSERIQLEHDVRSYGRENARLTASARVALAEQIGQQIERWAEAELDREQRSLAALNRLVEALAAVEGRKAVVLATAGIRTNPARGLYAALDQLRGAITSSDLNRSPALEIQGQDLQRQFEDVVRAAQNARVAFYTVSPVVAPPAENSAEFASAGSIADRPLPRDLAVVDAASSIARLAGATGGTALTIGPDLSRHLEAVTTDRDAAYSIGFSTGEGAGDQDHRIDVRVRRPGLAVRHRESFRRRSAGDRAESALAAAVTFGQAENPLEISLRLGAGKPDGTKKGGQIVPLAVGIPLHLVTLVPAGAERHGNLSVRVAVEDARGRMLEGSAAAVPIVVPEDQMAKAMVSSWYHRAEMRLAPGRQRIAVTVLDEISGVQSTVFEEIEIPAAK